MDFMAPRFRREESVRLELRATPLRPDTVRGRFLTLRPFREPTRARGGARGQLPKGSDPPDHPPLWGVQPRGLPWIVRPARKLHTSPPASRRETMHIHRAAILTVWLIGI